MKIFIRFSIILLLITGIIQTFFPIRIFPSFYDVRYMGISSLVEACILYFLPKFFSVPPETENSEKKNHSVYLFQFLMAFVIINNTLGDLGLYQLYKIGLEYDKCIHFLSPFVMVCILPFILAERFGIKKTKAILVSMGLVVLGGILWEVFEYAADQILKTHIYGVYGTNSIRDTQFDLLFDTVGAFMGGIVAFYIKSPKFKQ